MQQNSFIVIKESLLNKIESVLSQINLLLEMFLIIIPNKFMYH